VTEGIMETLASALQRDPNAKIVCIGGPDEKVRLEIEPEALIHPRYHESGRENNALLAAWQADLDRQVREFIASSSPERVREARAALSAAGHTSPEDWRVANELSPGIVSRILNMMKSKPSTPVQSGDVGVMRIKTGAPTNLVKLLPADRVRQGLLPGEEVAYIGFPSENLQRLGNEGRVAQKIHRGYLMALSEFDGSPGTPETNRLLHYDLVTAGGASGSPVFNDDGYVIGLNSAGNYIGVTAEATAFGQIRSGKVMRIKTGTAYGQRIDFLYDVLSGNAVRRTLADVVDDSE
jgi:hypothetical protein